MTTKVTIEAHCNQHTTQVEVKVYDGYSGPQTVETSHLQDGDKKEVTLFDKLQVSVREVPKE